MGQTEFKEVRSTSMTGKPPDGSSSWAKFAASIPLYETVEAELFEEDPKPFFVTLDVLQVGVTSANGLYYDDGLVQAIQSQLAGKGAKFGHTNWSDRGSPADAADWVGHKQIGDRVYAKAYLPPGKEREQIRRIIKRGGELRTSLEGYGTPIPILDANGEDTGTYRLAEFQLKALDFVDPIEAALASHLSGMAIHSTETKQEQPPMTQPSKITLADVPADVKEQILREANLTQENDRLKIELKTAQEAAQRASELQTQLTEAQNQVKTLTEANTALTAIVSNYREADFGALLDAETNKLTPWHITTETGKTKVASFRELFKQTLTLKLGETRDPAAVTAQATTLWETQFKGLAESLLQSLGGGSAFVQPKQPNKDTSAKLDDPEYRKEIKAEWGV